MIIPDAFSLLVGLFIPQCNIGVDIGIHFPFPCFQKNLVKFRCHRNGHLFPRLELFDLNPLMFEIDILPMNQNAIFKSLPSIHAEVKNHLYFILVDESIFRVIQNGSDLFLLFPCECHSPNSSILFFPCFAEKDLQGERISVLPITLQRGKNFTEPNDFSVMGRNRNLSRPQILRKFH